MRKQINIKKEEHLWTSEEKIKWMGEGEWAQEADRIEFEYLDYQAKIIRVVKNEPYAKEEAYFGGHLCGYVKIPGNHPLYQNEKECWNADLECHGGITYSEADKEEHWVGFDCGHSLDYIPTMEHFQKTRTEFKEIRDIFCLPEGFEKFPLFYPVYRNIEYVINSCMKLIDNLIAMKNDGRNRRHSTSSK